jgi:DNA-binding LytR/AlgR family response regulator
MLQPFFVREDKLLRKVNPEDVVCLSTEKNYTKIFLSDRSYFMVRSSLSNALKKLPADIFIKVHRAIAVSVYHIESIDKDHLLIGNEPIPIGKQYYQSLIDRLNIID